MSSLTLYRLGQSAPEKLAARELRRCLAALTGQPVTVKSARAYEPLLPGLWLGEFEHFRLLPRRGADATRDDQVAIHTGPTGGLIAGSNPRSVLLAAYRYLTALGCRWVRPGKKGEYLPALGPQLPAVEVRETASYRHRGVCIEGAVSWEHVRDLVEWLPRLGFNGYFIQFREAQTFFQRWYEHEGNPLYAAEEFTTERARELTAKLRAAVKQRGLDLHMVGHGWTCEPFGIPGPGWYPHQGPLPKEAIPFLAEVKGKRELWGQIALNTNLCYGNPETRRIVVEAIVEWAQANPDVDIIHFWLADGSNNQCECPLCRKHRPSDLYVKMLNALDEALTVAGLSTRIVFLAYVDLLWPPLKERIANPDRFLLMFAPITRSYSSAFTEVGVSPDPLPPFKLNKLKFPADPAVNLAFLKGWQDQFPGEGFDFDYHFMWDHFKDPAQYESARVLHQDLQGLRSIGLDGFMSCQLQRLFFPTGLGMTVLGRTLWDRTLGLREIAADHVQACYGDGGGEVLTVLKQLSKLFAPRVMRNEASAEEIQNCVPGWQRIPKLADKLTALAAAGQSSPVACHAESWRLLGEFAAYCRLLSAALVAKYTAPAERGRAAALALVDWARHAEKRVHPVWDLFEFQLTIGRFLGLTGEDLSR